MSGRRRFEEGSFEAVKLYKGEGLVPLPSGHGDDWTMSVAYQAGGRDARSDIITAFADTNANFRK